MWQVTLPTNNHNISELLIHIQTPELCLNGKKSQQHASLAIVHVLKGACVEESVHNDII